MEHIVNSDLLGQILEQERILEHFTAKNLSFGLVKYSRHELLCAPGRPLQDLLFVVKGGVWVYGLREDGSTLSVSRGVGKTTLGTMEFTCRDLPVFYVQALDEVLCVALSLEKNRAALENDPVFLRFALSCLAQIIVNFTLIGHAEQSIEEKVLIFLHTIQPDHTLHSINEGLLQFHCSRRQLQRVVKKLCEEGKLEKLGKGKYRLTEDIIKTSCQ